jgi:hypothetical protein
LAEIVNLFEVVLAVDPMKFSPLTPGQGSEDGMVEHSGAVAKASFALRNLIVHGGDPRPNVAYEFFNRHSREVGHALAISVPQVSARVR